MIVSESAPAIESYHQVRFPYDPRRSKVWGVIGDYLRPWIAPDQGMLELGAGYGEFINQVRAAKKFALDQNPALAAYWGEEVQPLIQSALDPWPIPDSSLGGVFASNFFEHFTIDQGVRILAQARRALRPAGRLIVVQPNFRLEPRRYFDNYTHCAVYTDNGFADLLRANGWKILRSEPRFMPFTMKSRLPTAPWLIRLYLALPFRPLAGQFLVIAEKA